MQVKVRLLRHQGRNLRHQEQLQLPPYVGELRIAEARDPYLSRQVVRARLLAPGTEADVLPVLLDARLLSAANNELRLTGFEQVESSGYAQTWVVEVQ